MNTKSLIWVVILVVIELLTIEIIKRWSIDQKMWMLIVGLVGYLIVGGIFAYILYQKSDLVIVNSMWQTLNVVLVAILGLVVYKERLNTTQYIGIMLAIIATVLLSFT